MSWTPPPTGELSTPDGRVLRYCLYGPDDGAPVVSHAGTPGTRYWRPEMIDIAERCGLRVLAYDRPGYGGSTRRPGRSVADAADDVALLVDAQGWDRFATVGGSGGGPHALACAVRLADRVIRCAAVVCPAPYVPHGPDGTDGPDGPAGLGQKSWFAGMSPGNIVEFMAASQGEADYRPLVERLGREAMANIEKKEPEILSGYDLPEADIEEMRRRLAAPPAGWLERAHAMWLDGFDGWIDDSIAMVRPWGVNMADLRVAVALWYGPDDVLVPRGHTEWLLAHLPGVERRELPGGHMLSDDSTAEMFGWVGGQSG
jgi:pimeloyl-ACP methyl ester carboxylesterase